jgi:hypothetical protein
MDGMALGLPVSSVLLLHSICRGTVMKFSHQYSFVGYLLDDQHYSYVDYIIG